MVELASREDAYYQNWNIPAAHPITGLQLKELIKKELGYIKKFRTISKRMIKGMGIFSPFMKEMVEMMYLTEHPVILSGEKYRKEIGSIPKTSYQEGIIKTLEWMKSKNEKKSL